MTQQAVERTLGKLLTDEKLRERFFVNPETACWEAGLTLSAIELEALSRVPRGALRSLHEHLGKRIIRPCPDPDPGEAGAVHRLALVLIATMLVGVSAWRFRGQLS